MDTQRYQPHRRLDLEFERARAKYYLTAVHRVLAGISIYERAGLFTTKKIHIQGVPYTLPQPIGSGPQCVTVPLHLNRSQDLDRVTPLSDRFALEARSQFARVYRDRGLVMVEFTLPPEQWLRVRVRDLPHRKDQPSFGELSLGQVARMSFDTSPHKLISGGSQTGKTTTELAALVSLVKAHTPGELGLVILNPKGDARLARFARVPHLVAPIGVSLDECVNLLRLAIGEMELRLGDDTRSVTRWIIFIDELAELVQMRPEAGKMVTRLVQLAGGKRINVIAATQSPIPSVFGEKGSLAQANFGSYIVHQLPNQLAYYGTGGLTHVRTAELGGGSEEGRGDGYAITGGVVRRFRGAWVEESDYAALPRRENEPAPVPADLLAGDAAVDDSAGMKWELDHLADRLGYALTVAQPSANGIFQHFKGQGQPWSMDRARWVKALAQKLQSRIEYWGSSPNGSLALIEGDRHAQ